MREGQTIHYVLMSSKCFSLIEEYNFVHRNAGKGLTLTNLVHYSASSHILGLSDLHTNETFIA